LPILAQYWAAGVIDLYRKVGEEHAEQLDALREALAGRGV
jgi:hypothetical protein